MREVEVKEAGKMLAQLVEAAEAAEEVVLTRAGKPVAQLVRLPFAASGIQVGVLKGRLPDDLVDSINRPSISSVLASGSRSTRSGRRLRIRRAGRRTSIL